MSGMATPQSLANQMFQVPQAGTPAAPQAPVQQPAAPQMAYPQPAVPQTPGSTLSGGSVTPQPVQPPATGAAPAGYPQQPAAPAAPAAPMAPAAPAAPVAPAGQTPVSPAAPQPSADRRYIDRFVNLNLLSPEDARRYSSDEAFLFDLAMLASQNGGDPDAGTPNTPAAPAQQTPAAPQQPSPFGDDSDIEQLAFPLINSGSIVMEGGRYISKYSEFQPIADRLNQSQLQTQQQLRELRNPAEWMKKHGASVIQELTKPLHDEIASLRQQLDKTLPKPHEAWVDKHRTQLYLNDASGNPTQELSPVGKVYENAYVNAANAGVADPHALHSIAASAAEAVMPQIAPQNGNGTPAPTFWQQAGATPAATNPGFNSPGAPLSNQQAEQSTIPTDTRGFPDMLALARAATNGSLQI